MRRLAQVEERLVVAQQIGEHYANPRPIMLTWRNWHTRNAKDVVFGGSSPLVSTMFIRGYDVASIAVRAEEQP